MNCCLISNKERTARVCTVEAPCKINLHLVIKEKRPDGFHMLESLFASLALSDTLRFEINKSGKKGGCLQKSNNLRFSDQLFADWELPPHECPGKPIPPENNLVSKAVLLFREKTGFEEGLNIRLRKRIPAGAGLGGGSSDAASTLLALNALAGTALPIEELKEMAAVLGSDVPFFISGGAAFVGGRGELIEPLKPPEGLWVVLVKPPFSSDTASAYRLLDETRESASGPVIPKENLPKNVIIKSLEDDPFSWPYQNDFLHVFLSARDGENGKKALAYRAVLQRLEKAGAVFTGLSGSGSCCFGVFIGKKSAKRAEKELSGCGNFVKLTFFLAYKADPVLE